MNVTIKDLSVHMQLGNNGIELEVKDPQNRHLGDLCIGRATIEWCPGRTRRGGGKRKTWNDLIAFFRQ
jgi:hypothetical protein